MAKFYRRLFFWVFFLLFFITTPLVIYYSQGYRFDNYSKIFVHSGSITIKSLPSGVSVYLNGELQPQRTLDIINNSTTVNGLRPGNYDLRVTSSGYGSWEKSIEVHSGVSTEFWNVFLPPQNLDIQNLNAAGAFRFFVSPFGKKISYVKENAGVLEIWALDVKNKVASLVSARPNSSFPDDPLENIEWNFKERLAVIPEIENGNKDYVVLDMENNQKIISLSDASKLQQINRVRWSPSDQNTLYLLAKEKTDGAQNLYLFNTQTSTLAMILENVNAFDLSNNALYFVDSNRIVYKTNLDGGSREQITISPLPIDDGFAKNLRLIAYDDNRQALLTENGDFIIHNNSENDSIQKIGSGVKGVQFSDDGKKILFWSDNEISVLYLREWEVQPRREENQIDQVARFATTIRNVSWFRDYEHIFFSTQNQLKLVELDSRDHRNMSDILKYNSENFSSFYDSSNGVFYYLDQTDNENNIFYFNIPQQTSFFGG